MIDWTDSIRVQRPDRRWRTQYRVYCEHPNCPTESPRYLEKRDALRSHKHCYRCSQSIKGKAGFRAALRKGKAFAGIQQHRLKNPSSLELIVANWLTDLKIEFEREALICSTRRANLVDFRIDRVCIEVNGEYVHRERGVFDKQKRRSLRAMGYKVIDISEQQVRSGDGLLVLRSFFSS